MHRRSLPIRCFVLLAALVSMAPRCANSALPRLELRLDDRVALVGNSLAERMRLHGHFETLLHLRFPYLQLRVRNFGWPCDEVGQQQRPNDYTQIDDPLEVFAPDVFLCFFGYNESFAGPEGVKNFEAAYRSYLASLRERFTKNGEGPRFALVSPVAYEATGQALMPSGEQENENLRLYTAAIKRVAEAEDVPVVDLYEPTLAHFLSTQGADFTINGAHLNDAGYRFVAEALDAALFDETHPTGVSSPQYDSVRSVVIDLEWYHQQDYRMVNGWYVYGGRSKPLDVETFPAEYAKIRKMVADRDQIAWALAQGETPPEIDDTDPALRPRPTTFGTKPYSEPEVLRILSPEEALDAMTVFPGYRVETFADEVRFPELANPVQMNFDNRGRLWVACMPTYPQWKPGQPKPNDRLLIFEDTDNDGQADTVKVFADNLHCPTGFEFWSGGVLVTSQPRLMFLKDTDGDDRADVEQVFLDGFASDDTHHAIGAFEWTPDGQLVMLEGISLSTTVETPWGPFRNHNRSVAYALDPRRWRMGRHITPCFANPWCYTNNDWGQGFVGDGTGAQQHWATPLTGAQFPGRRGNERFIHYSGGNIRPALGNGFIYSRHFPDDAQGNFYYACVINVNGIVQFQVQEQGSGYRGTRVADLVTSTDANFRPGDPQIGTDGALYFVDWHNPLIGHMQYSQRDPNRDHRHGRIYRLSVEVRSTVTPVTQADKSIAQLLDQFREYEARTRYRARRELRDRPTAEVVAAVEQLRTTIDPDDPLRDRMLTEALWTLEGHHVVNRQLLEELLAADTPNARAAAVHAVSNQREWIDDAVEIIAPMVHDPHPRVRLEAIRALSFFPTVQAVELALEALDQTSDEELGYTLRSTLGALQPVWEAAQKNGVELADGDPDVARYLARVADYDRIERRATRSFNRLESAAQEIEDEIRSLIGLADEFGDPHEGAQVFRRNCQACHRVGVEGAVYGPDLSDVGARLQPREILVSILDPNAKIEEKYQATNIVTMDGKVYSGLVTREDENQFDLLLGDGKLIEIAHEDVDERQKVEVSSMPGKMQESISSSEFIDLLRYLAIQKTPPIDAQP